MLATGFKATEYLEGIDVVGVDGRRLHDDWSEVAHAYMGLTVSGLPQLLHALRAEHEPGRQLHHIDPRGAGYVRPRRRCGPCGGTGCAALEVRRDVMDAYNRELAEALAGTIWSEGCQSYFKNANGKIATQLPQTTRWYAQSTKRFRMREYVRS